MKKHLLIWLVVVFFITVIASILIGKMVDVSGIINYVVLVVIFVVVGYVLYDPIKNKWE